MKPIIYFLFSLLNACFLFVACEKPDKEEEAAIETPTPVVEQDKWIKKTDMNLDIESGTGFLIGG